jgi:hypothetical protein
MRRPWGYEVLDYALGRFTPYFERLRLRLTLLVDDGPMAPEASSVPADDVVANAREVLHAAPANEDDRVLLEVVPSPGMYEVTSMPLVRRTRQTLRSAEFGFFGVVVYTRTQTPRFCGQPAVP